MRSFGHPRTSRALRPRRGRIPLFTSVLLSLSPDRFEPSPRKHSSCTVIRLGFLLLVHLDPTGHEAMTARNPRARLELNRRRARLGRRTEHARASSRAQGHVEACSWGSHTAGRGAGVAHTRPRRATEAALPSWAVISTNERSDAGGGAVSPTCHASAPEPMLARGVAPLSGGVCCLRGPACIPLLPRARAQRAGGDPASPRAHLTASHGLLEVCAVRQKMRKEERRGVTPGPREASCRHAGQTERRRHRVARTSPRLHHYAYVTALQHRSTAPLYVTALRHRVCGAALRHRFTSPHLRRRFTSPLYVTAPFHFRPRRVSGALGDEGAQ